MTIINLRDFYYWYTQDEYMEVSDDVAEALRASVRYEAAYTERARYNKAKCNVIGKEEQWHELKTEEISRHIPLHIQSGAGVWASTSAFPKRI